jgi:hypothetical protein
MSRSRRLMRRRGIDRRSIHSRARDLAAQRVDVPLAADEAAWLEQHLADCQTCRAAATAYATDHRALRGLRAVELEPPRDLWARTHAALEREGFGRAASEPGWSAGQSSRRRLPLGVLSGVAVVAVVIGASLLSGGWLDSPVAVESLPSASAAVAAASPVSTPGPTPIVVGAGSVRWVGTAADGALAYSDTDIAEVCAEESKLDCAPVSGHNATPVDLKVKPRSITQSPVGDQAVVVGSDGAGGDTVVVVVLPPPSHTPVVATPSPTPTESGSPPTPAATPSSDPTESVEPTPAETPDVTATSEPTVSPTASASGSPVETPEPTLAASLAIATGVNVVGGSAAYSPDGDWFAFTARAADGSAGPDIYVWQTGDASARALTDDHRSVFGSWIGGRLIGSRAVDSQTGDGSALVPESFVLDPSTGEALPLADPIWRPVVGPRGQWAVGWDGTLKSGPDGATVGPDSGTLVLARFDAADGALGDITDIVADEAIGDFEVRWDGSGRWLAVWLADETDPTLGRLSLYRLDPDSGRLERPKGAPQDVTASAGFSIGDGRLAWATPPGQGGEGSRVQVVAWTDEAVGAVESDPVEDVILIH